MASQGAKSVMSKDMQELSEGKEQISSEIRGHKANLANPSEFISCRRSQVKSWQPLTTAATDTSEESKEHSRQVIDRLGGDGTLEGHRENPVSKSAADNLEGSRGAAG